MKSTGYKIYEDEFLLSLPKGAKLMMDRFTSNQISTTGVSGKKVARVNCNPTLKDMLPLLPLRLKEIGLGDPIELFLYANDLPISLAVTFLAVDPSSTSDLKNVLREVTALRKIETTSNHCVMTFTCESAEVSLETVIEEVYLADLEALAQLVIN